MTSKNVKLVFYADDISTIIICPSSVECSTKVNTLFADINESFRSNLLSLNFNKTRFLQFRTKNSPNLDLNITLFNKHITNTTDIKLLGLTTDETSWKCHINHILSGLGTARYAIRTVTPLMAEKSLRFIFLYVHSITTRGII
jgi:hypothetical protein